MKMNIYVNNQLKPIDYIVQDNDAIHLSQPKTIQDFLVYASSIKLGSTKGFTVKVNNQQVSLDMAETKVYVNNQKASMHQTLKQHDKLVIATAIDPKVSDLLNKLSKKYSDKIQVSFNGEPVEMKQQQLTVKRDNMILNENSILKPNDSLEIIKKTQEPFILQDVFRYVDIDLTKATGKFQIYKNNESAAFFDPLRNGDHIRIEFE